MIGQTGLTVGVWSEEGDKQEFILLVVPGSSVMSGVGERGVEQQFVLAIVLIDFGQERWEDCPERRRGQHHHRRDVGEYRHAGPQ